jgi:hypothetical protein
MEAQSNHAQPVRQQFCPTGRCIPKFIDDSVHVAQSSAEARARTISESPRASAILNQSRPVDTPQDAILRYGRLQPGLPFPVPSRVFASIRG